MASDIHLHEFAEIRRLIDEHHKILVIGHIDPDGDCIGSMLAIAHFLAGKGKEVKCFTPGETAEVYTKLPGYGMFTHRDDVAVFDHDMIFSLDSPTTARTAEIVRPGPGEIIVNIDHHPTNERYGTVNVVDDRAAATAVLIYRFLEATAAGEITGDIADALYLGVLMDTGGFRFQNTNAEALETAARLVGRGANAYELSREFIYMKTLAGLRLLGEALISLEIHRDGRIAVMNVTREMLERADGSFKDTEGFVDYANSIDGVELCALLREIGEGETRISLRARNDFNVAEFAERYGGGGHRSAAGLTVHEGIDRAKRLVIRGLEELLDGAGRPPFTDTRGDDE